jgi:hypothetical protein
MIRSAVSKVMWVGRATVFLVALASTLALVPAYQAGLSLAEPRLVFAPRSALDPRVEILNQKFVGEVIAGSPTSHAEVARLPDPYATTAPAPKGARLGRVARR